LVRKDVSSHPYGAGERVKTMPERDEDGSSSPTELLRVMLVRGEILGMELDVPRWFLGSTQNLYYRAATYNRRALTLALTRRVVVKPLSRVHRANLKRKELIQTRGIHGEMRGRLMGNGDEEEKARLHPEFRN